MVRRMVHEHVIDAVFDLVEIPNLLQPFKHPNFDFTHVSNAPSYNLSLFVPFKYLGAITITRWPLATSACGNDPQTLR